VDRDLLDQVRVRPGCEPAAQRFRFFVEEEQRGAREAAIRFFPDGSATGGRISLGTQDAGWRVDVRWLTGEVSVARLQEVSP